MRRFTVAILAAAFITLSGMFSVSSAYADSSYLEEATQGLQQKQLYVSPAVRDFDATAQARLITEIGTSDIAIAVLPQAAVSDAIAHRALADDLVINTGHATVGVIVGSAFEASSNTLPAGSVSIIAHDAMAENDSMAIQAASTFVREVRSAMPAVVSSDASSGSSTSLVPVVLTILLFTVLLAGGVPIVRKFFKRPTVQSAEEGSVERILGEIREWMPRISTNNPLGKQVISSLHQSEVDIGQLFKRLQDASTSKQELASTRQQYVTLLTSVLQTVETYVDMQDYPQYYGEGLRQKHAEVAESIQGYAKNVRGHVSMVARGELKAFYTALSNLQLWTPPERNAL